MGCRGSANADADMTSDSIPVKAVIFDWGGTLTPWHDIDLVAQWAEYARVYDPLDEGLAQRLADAELAQWAEQQATRGSNGTGALDHIWASVGVDTGSPRHHAAQQAYLRGWDPHTIADPDAAGVLATLRDAGILIGLLSNTMWPRSHHEEVFARDGLLDLIDVAVYSSELPVAKPHSDAFRAVLDGLGITASESVFVGDRPWDDIHGAQQVGMRAILIPHSRLGDQAVDVAVAPDAIAHRISDVIDIIDSWR
jgi:putative hydrolase of the HAD superfamily